MNIVAGSPVGTTYSTSRYAQPTIQSATPTAWTTGNSPITLWTITGTILCRLHGAVGATQFTSTAGTGTLAIGVAAATGSFIAATTANGTTNFIANAVWFDTAPTVTQKLWNVTSANPGAWTELANTNIILTIATNSMTAGAVNLYLDWIPVSSGATVVSGSP